MRTLPIFATTLALSLIGTTTALASPAIPHPPLASNERVATVDWHPSTSHWDHHFHAHQDSLRSHQPTVAERRIHRMMRRAAPHARYEVEVAPRYRLGSSD